MIALSLSLLLRLPLLAEAFCVVESVMVAVDAVLAGFLAFRLVAVALVVFARVVFLVGWPLVLAAVLVPLVVALVAVDFLLPCVLAAILLVLVVALAAEDFLWPCVVAVSAHEEFVVPL